MLDERVDPSARNNHAIYYSAMNGQKQEVELLLRDPRVDPSRGLEGARVENHTSIIHMIEREYIHD